MHADECNSGASDSDLSCHKVTGAERNRFSKLIYPGATRKLDPTISAKHIKHTSTVSNDKDQRFLQKINNNNNNNNNIVDIRDSTSSFDLAWVKNSSRPEDKRYSSNLSVASVETRSSEARFDGSHRLQQARNKTRMQSHNDYPDIKSSRDQMESPTATRCFVTLEDDAAFSFDAQSLEGQLTDGPVEFKMKQTDDYNQLDEPILATLMRDLRGIYQKTKIIALPLSSYDIYKVVLRDWDLWGPLLLCTFLSFSLHHSEKLDNHNGPHFADVFVLVWLGSYLISLNYKLLSVSSVNSQAITFGSQQSQEKIDASDKMTNSGSGDLAITTDAPGRRNVSQSYRSLLSPPSIFQLMCVFGYCLISPCIGLILLKVFATSSLLFERTIIGLLTGFVWPTYCAKRILARYQHPDKRVLAMYPIGLFYFVLSCMIILNH